jgi:hypothetical protein
MITQDEIDELRLAMKLAERDGVESENEYLAKAMAKRLATSLLATIDELTAERDALLRATWNTADDEEITDAEREGAVAEIQRQIKALFEAEARVKELTAEREALEWDHKAMEALRQSDGGQIIQLRDGRFAAYLRGGMAHRMDPADAMIAAVNSKGEHANG